METRNMDAKRIIVIFVMTIGLIIVNAYLSGCDEGDDDCASDCDTDGDTDGDTDSDTDSDTDGDTDGDTDSDTEVDPTACDCFKSGDGPADGDDPEEGEYCFNIEGDWWVVGEDHNDESYMLVTLTPTVDGCSIAFSGDGATLLYTQVATSLPIISTDEFDNYISYYVEGVNFFLKKFYSSQPDDFDALPYER